MYTVKVNEHFFKDMFSPYRYLSFVKNDVVFAELRLRQETIAPIKTLIEQVPKLVARSVPKYLEGDAKVKFKAPFVWLPIRASDAGFNEREALINIALKDKVLASFVHLSGSDARALIDVLNIMYVELIELEYQKIKMASPPAWNKRHMPGVTFV